MKITFVLPFTKVGGGVRVVFEYSNRLIKNGHDVRIVYPIIPPLLHSKSTVKLAKYKTIESLRNLKRKNEVKWFDLSVPLIKVFSLNPRYVQFSEQSIPDADVVIATSWETAYFVNSLAPKKGKKFYFVQHYEIWDIWNSLNCWESVTQKVVDKTKLPITMSYITPKDSYLKKMKMSVDNTYTLPLMKITISSWLKELLEQRFKQKVYGTITNGVNSNLFRCSKEKDWNSNKRIILMPYRGEQWKGDLDGMTALEYINKHYNDVEIWLYGMKKPSRVPEWAHFFEGLSDEKLAELYCLSHVLVIPSWVEGCQLPPMEGMASKCAIVATNVGGVPDYAVSNETAVVVPPHDPKKLEEGIMYLLDNWERAKVIAENGYTHIKQFTWEKATEELYEALLKGYSDIEAEV